MIKQFKSNIYIRHFKNREQSIMNACVFKSTQLPDLIHTNIKIVF